jgi:hypothetical protein
MNQVITVPDTRAAAFVAVAAIQAQGGEDRHRNPDFLDQNPSTAYRHQEGESGPHHYYDVVNLADRFEEEEGRKPSKEPRWRWDRSGRAPYHHHGYEEEESEEGRMSGHKKGPDEEHAVGWSATTPG